MARGVVAQVLWMHLAFARTRAPACLEALKGMHSAPRHFAERPPGPPVLSSATLRPGHRSQVQRDSISDLILAIAPPEMSIRAGCDPCRSLIGLCRVEESIAELQRGRHVATPHSTGATQAKQRHPVWSRRTASVQAT